MIIPLPRAYSAVTFELPLYTLKPIPSRITSLFLLSNSWLPSWRQTNTVASSRFLVNAVASELNR